MYWEGWYLDLRQPQGLSDWPRIWMITSDLQTASGAVTTKIRVRSAAGWYAVEDELDGYASEQPTRNDVDATLINQSRPLRESLAQVGLPALLKI